jgi:hypothetical protein
LTTGIPPSLSASTSLLDAQPAPVQAALHYCLGLLMMAEAGKARLVETVPGENGPVCVFESSAGERFSLAKPAMTKEQEATAREISMKRTGCDGPALSAAQTG